MDDHELTDKAPSDAEVNTETNEGDQRSFTEKGEPYRFKPGHTMGRGPKKQTNKSIIGYLKRKLNKDGGTLATELGDALVEHYKAGNPTAIKELLARLEGPVESKSSVTLDLSRLSDDDLDRLEELNFKLNPNSGSDSD
jgi:hypothetical protein